jgi:hypothetical protein
MKGNPVGAVSDYGFTERTNVKRNRMKIHKTFSPNRQKIIKIPNNRFPFFIKATTTIIKFSWERDINKKLLFLKKCRLDKRCFPKSRNTTKLSSTVSSSFSQLVPHNFYFFSKIK